MSLCTLCPFEQCRIVSLKLVKIHFVKADRMEEALESRLLTNLPYRRIFILPFTTEMKMNLVSFLHFSFARNEILEKPLIYDHFPSGL